MRQNIENLLYYLSQGYLEYLQVRILFKNHPYITISVLERLSSVALGTLLLLYGTLEINYNVAHCPKMYPNIQTYIPHSH